MWLVLCTSTDLPALWAAQGLQTRGLEPLVVIHPEMLTHAVVWDYRAGAGGAAIEIQLTDGRTIQSRMIRGVLNRFCSAPFEPLRCIRPDDRAYATQEFTAFYLSWLCALPPPLINRPTPQGLCGQWRHLSDWTWLAAHAGLPTSRYTQTSRDVESERDWQGRRVPPDAPVQTLIVIGDQMVGSSAPSTILAGCRRFAQLAGTALLGVDFSDGPGGLWTFAGATPCPDLRQGGEALLDALATILQRGQEAHS